MFFFYGTLIDPAVRAAVLGRHADRAAIVPDVLAGWRIVGVRGRSYPVVVPAPDASAIGVRAAFPARDTRSVTEKLIAFEGSEYSLQSLFLESGEEASVFTGSALCRPTGRPWSFEDWQRRHKRAFLAAVQRGRLV